MKKKMLKNQKGISLLVLMITIVILAILAGMAVTHIDTGKDIKEYNYMCADIELLESKIMTYYNKYNDIPITGTVFNAKSTLGDQASSRDNDNYYQINIGDIYNITLNYGGGTRENEDIYIINEQSHEVYYLKGVKLEGVRYYTKK